MKINDMRLHLSVMQQAPVRVVRAWAKSGRIFARAGVALICASAAQHVAAGTNGVYVAGQGATLEQVFGQALASSKGKKDTFWVVAAGKEAIRLSRSAAGQELQGALTAVRERGGIVYACRSDLLRAGVKEEDLLDGVASVYGYGAQEWAGLLPVKRSGTILPTDAAQSQRILKTCTGDLQAVSQ